MQRSPIESIFYHGTEKHKFHRNTFYENSRSHENKECSKRSGTRKVTVSREENEWKTSTLRDSYMIELEIIGAENSASTTVKQ